MLNLVPLQGVGPEKLQELQNYCCDKFWKSVQARNTQVEGMYQRWKSNYDGKPKEAIRTTPFYKASNFVPQLIRMHTDILSARVLGLLFGIRPFWKVKSFNQSLPADVLSALSEWLDSTCSNEIDFYEPIDMSIFLSFKTGTQITKTIWGTDEVYISKDGTVVPLKEESMTIDVVPYDDFFPYPVTARTLKQTIAKFHRLRFAKEEILYRKSRKIWDEKACDLLINSGGKQSEGNARETEAASAGVSLSVDVSRPFNVIEGWVNYELEPGKLYSLVVTFNPMMRTSEGILRALYDYTPQHLGVFTDFRPMPREDLFYGYSIPEILEQSQEEQAQIHNARRDANSIANVPGWKKKRGADVGSPSTEWYPGKVFEVDNMDDLQPLTFGGSYNSLTDEENALLQLAERYTGISPAMQGFGAGSMGKKGIYSSQGTMALLSEGNKRLDVYLRRLRAPFHNLGSQIFTSYRDFKSSDSWSVYGENGELLKKAFQCKEPAETKGLFFGLSASDAGANKEVERQGLLLMANTMAAYYKQIMSLIPPVVQAPEGSPFKELGLQILDGARDLANRLLFTFDIYDRKHLLPDVREIMAGGKSAPRSPAADNIGLPQANGAVSTPELQTLSSTIGQIAGGIGSSSFNEGQQSQPNQ